MTDVYPLTSDAIDDKGTMYVAPVTEPDDLDKTFDVLIVARSRA